MPFGLEFLSGKKSGNILILDFFFISQYKWYIYTPYTNMVNDNETHIQPLTTTEVAVSNQRFVLSYFVLYISEQRMSSEPGYMKYQRGLIFH